MATDAKFDPYYHWLGIPPKDRPLNYYRLLSLELFESDEAVIRAAVKRQRAYLQSMAEEDHPEVCAKILAQIKSAGAVLLDPEKRASYDTKLKAQLFDAQHSGGGAVPTPAPRPQQVARAVVSKPPAKPEPDAEEKKPLPFSAAPVGGSSGSLNSGEAKNLARRRKQKKSQQTILTSVVALLCVVALAVVGYNMMNRNDSPPVAVNDDAASQPPRRTSGGDLSATRDLRRRGEGSAPVATDTPQDTEGAADDATEALFQSAEAAIEEGRTSEGIELLKEYVASPAATRKKEARSLLAEAEKSVSRRYFVEHLLGLGPSFWSQVGPGSQVQYPTPNFSRISLAAEFNRTGAKTQRITAALYQKKQGGENIEPYLAALEQLPADAPDELPAPVDVAQQPSGDSDNRQPTIGGSGEVEAIMEAAVAAVEDSRLDDAADFLRDYLGNEAALRKIEAELLLEDIEHAQSNRFAVEWLLGLPDESWREFEATNQLNVSLELPNFEYEVLNNEFEAAWRRCVARALAVWNKKQAGEDIEPYLIAIDRQSKTAPDTLPDPADPADPEAMPDDAAVVHSPVPEEPEEVGDPTDYLTGKGLVNDGKIWTLPSEEEIRDRIKDLSELKKAVTVAEKKIPGNALQQLQVERQKIAQGEAMLEQMSQQVRQAGLITGPQQDRMNSLRMQLDRKRTWVANTEVAIAEPLAGLQTAHQEYAAAVNDVLAFITGIEEEYARLEANPSVKEALTELSHRLGPTSAVKSGKDRLLKLKESLDEADQNPAAGGLAPPPADGDNRIQGFGPNANPPAQGNIGGVMPIGGF
ncbi:MAG: hypothetical protein WD030_00790 [Pirellulales bacterium]